MKCTIPARNIKVFGRAIQCLGKIGEDIYIEGETNGLAVRTVNMSRSAYASYLFLTSFFSKFSLQSQNSCELRCKLSSRSCLSIFKNVNSLEKQVDQLALELRYEKGEFVVTLEYRNGARRQYHLTFQECEGLTAVFHKNASLVHITAADKFLNECMQHFPPSVGEITISVTTEHAILSNFVEEDDQYSKVLQTQIKLISSEFSEFQVSTEREITFCLKEFRAILSFQDFSAQQLHIYFDLPGKPVIMSIDNDGSYECDFVLATLSDQNNTQYSQSSIMTKNLSTTKDTETSFSRTQDNPFIKRNGKPFSYNNHTKRNTQKSPVHQRSPSPPSSSPPKSPMPLSPPMLPSPPISPSPPMLPSFDSNLVEKENTPPEMEYIPDHTVSTTSSPPGKRFRRLSEDDDEGTVFMSSNLTNDKKADSFYCEESD